MGFVWPENNREKEMDPDRQIHEDSNPGAGAWLEALWQDIRFGIRMMTKNPGFSIAAIITLALGIGGNAAIFTIFNAVLLRPLPYADPQKLVTLAVARSGELETVNPFSIVRFEMIRDHSRSFDGVAAYAVEFFNLTGRGEPLQVHAARVSPNFFDVLGVKPQKGRFFAAEEGEPAGKNVVVISDSLWKNQFAADPAVLGQPITLDSAEYTIIGVLPPGFRFALLGTIDVWSPRFFELNLATGPQVRAAGTGYLTAIARLKSDTSIDKAATEMDILNQQYKQSYPKFPDAHPKITLVVKNLRDRLVANIRTNILFLFLAVALVLLIACANVAGLLLARALARTREIAVRAVLGAGRGALLRQLLTESLLLAAVSGALGLALGFAGIRVFSQIGPKDTFPDSALVIDGWVLLFVAGITLVTGLVFGIFPALQLSRTNVNQALRDEGRGSVGSRRRALVGNSLVVVQIGISMLLLVCAGSLVRSFDRLKKIDLGFDSRDLLTLNIALPPAKYSSGDKQVAFYEQCLRQMQSVPGVRRASISSALPLHPERFTPALPEGQAEVPLGQRPLFVIETVSPDYFQTMGISLKAGRFFTEHDNAQAPKVVIANEAMARRYWPNENAVGKRVLVGRGPALSEVVGVAGDVKNMSLADETMPQMYIPFPQLPWASLNLEARSTGDPSQLVSAVRNRILGIDPGQPITNVRTGEELVDAERSQPRFNMLVTGLFAAIALVLVIVGIYGVISYSVTQRQAELGIRLALGAEKRDILRLVVGHGLALTLIGIALGVIAALAVTKLTSLLSDLLYQANTRDWATFAACGVALIGIALAASYLPARRATNVDPSEALRRG
jgi:putative ABC transport system permease protein